MRKFAFILLISVVGLIGCDEAVETNVTGFRANTNLFEEGNENNIVTVTITAEGTIGSAVSVPFEIREKTALFNTDIVSGSGTLEFTSSTNQATVQVEIIGDNHFELGEEFEIFLNHSTPVSFVISINDDDEIQGIDQDGDGYITPDSYPSMVKEWSDEFDGTTLSPENWTYEIGDGCDKGICGWGNNELQNYTDLSENVKVENGRLVITAIEKAGDNYTSARIITQDKVEPQFGRIDIRAKMPKGQGIWPALWMLGANINEAGWPKCGEIDIMELVGHEPNITHGTVHYDDGGYKYSSNAKTVASGDLSDQFHVYSIVWDRNYISWYLDNQLFKTFSSNQTNTYDFNNPFFFIMNIAVGGNWPGNPDDTTVFPQTMEVDYIRVFK